MSNASVEFVHDWLSGFRSGFDGFFTKNQKMNAKIVLNAIESADIDKNAVLKKLKSLPETEWSMNFVIDTLKEINELMGISNEFIRSQAVTKLSDKDLNELKWDIEKEICLYYRKFSKELYDTLKYSELEKLSESRHLLMLEMMKTLKIVNEQTTQLHEKYYEKKFTPKTHKKFFSIRIISEALMLRIFFILTSADSEKKIAQYAKVLAKERIEYQYVRT